MAPEPSLRRATQDDAETLVDFIGMAGEGVPEIVWADMAEPAEPPRAVGLRRARREEGAFSYRNAWLLDAGDAPLAALIGYPLPPEPEPIGPDFPAPFIPLQKLENLAPGRWYVNVLAVRPTHRGQGLGTRLLAQAAHIARTEGCPGLAIIAFASNPDALRLYEREGFTQTARRPFTLPNWPHNGTDAILLLKDS